MILYLLCLLVGVLCAIIWVLLRSTPARDRRSECIVIGYLAIHGKAHGADFCNDTGIMSGDLYPALVRLEKMGMIRSEWEGYTTAQIAQKASGAAIPRRRFYEINPNHAIQSLIGSILQERKDFRADPMFFAARGDQITCQNGHHIATFARDVRRGEMFDLAAIRDWQQPCPPVGTMDQPCTICGAEWFKGTNLHFKGGWR